MTVFRGSTGNLQSAWRSISRTPLRQAQWLVWLSTSPGMNPERSHFRIINFGSYVWLSCTYRKRNEGWWITEPLPAYPSGTAYWLISTLYTILWPRRITAPEMWYSEKESCTQHRMLQTKQSWTSTSTEMSLRNPNPQESSQPEMEIPNVQCSSHWTMIHLWILQNQRRSHGNWLALRRRLVINGSHRPKVVAETVLERICWQSLHNRLSLMRNSRIWLPHMLQLRSLMIMRMWSIQSPTKQHPSLCSLRNGIRRWKIVRCQWSASSHWRFCGASRKEKVIAKSLGIQDEARWSRQCAAVQGKVILLRKLPNRRHRLPGQVCTHYSPGPWQAGTHDRRQERSWDPSNWRIHGFLGSWLGRRDQYAPAAGILLFGPNWKPIQRSKIKYFVQDDTPLENASFWPGAVLVRLVRHFQDLVTMFGFVASRVDGGLRVLIDNDQRMVVATVVLSVENLRIVAHQGLIV